VTGSKKTQFGIYQDIHLNIKECTTNFISISPEVFIVVFNLVTKDDDDLCAIIQ